MKLFDLGEEKSFAMYDYLKFIEKDIVYIVQDTMNLKFWRGIEFIEYELCECTFCSGSGCGVCLETGYMIDQIVRAYGQDVFDIDDLNLDDFASLSRSSFNEFVCRLKIHISRLESKVLRDKRDEKRKTNNSVL